MWRFNTATELPEKQTRDGEEAECLAEDQPTCFDTTDFGRFLDVSKDKLSISYTGVGLHDNDVGSIQGNQKVPGKRLIYYYEIEIVDAGDKGLIALGFADKSFKLGRHPGWEPNSYGYHAEHGRKMCGVVTGLGGEEYGPPYTTGDVVGAGILLDRQEIFFTRNGKNLGVAFRNVLKVHLYPTVGLHSRNEQIEVNFGHKPFVYDLEELIRHEMLEQQFHIKHFEVPSGVTHQVVRDYLLHHGYAETLKAFVGSAGLPQPEPSLTGVRSWQGAAETSLELREGIRKALMAGEWEVACQQLSGSNHQHLLGEDPSAATPSSLQVYFFLQCFAFIELIRSKRVVEALGFAKSKLAPLRGVFAAMSGAYDEMLADVVALLAYTQPQGSPLWELLEGGQREAVADMVNSAILRAASAPSRPQVALEQLLKQLVIVQRQLHAANGGHGQIFRLSEHLAPKLTRPLRHSSAANGSVPNGHNAEANGQTGL